MTATEGRLIARQASKRLPAALASSRRPPRRPPNMLSISPVLVRPSIDVPRSILIGPTEAPLNSPTPRTGPSSAAVVSVIARVVPIVVVVGVRAVAVVDALRLNDRSRSDCCGPDKAQRNSGFCYGPHDEFLLLVFFSLDDRHAALNAA
jgi:hypothetical protein